MLGWMTNPTRLSQPCIPTGSLNEVPALIGRGGGGNVSSTGWKVTLYEPIRHVSSHNGPTGCITAIRIYPTLPFTCDAMREHNFSYVYTQYSQTTYGATTENVR